MPTPDRTSLEEIIQAGRALVESEGLPRLTMQAVADRVGVRAPSLYKRVSSRDDLIRLIAEATVRDLGERLHAAVRGVDARKDLAAVARAFRTFAHERPAGYPLVFATGSAASGPSMDALEYASAPVLRIAKELAGPRYALEAARMITAWAHGFVTMELAGAFNFGGNIDRAYEFGISRLTRALIAPDGGAPARATMPPAMPTGRRKGGT